MANYYPAIKSARTLGASPLGVGHRVALLDNIVSLGKVQYTFILAVYDNVTRQVCYCVASEANAMAALGGGSHFLGVFDGNGHRNLGSSNDWADPKLFFPRALQLAAAHVGIQPTPPNQG